MDWKLILQIAGVVLGLLYIWLEYKVNIWLWIIGAIMPMVHGILFYKQGLYGDFAMEIYYVLAGVYGLVFWIAKGGQKKEGKNLSVTRVDRKTVIVLIPVYVVLHAALYFLLSRFTNSTVPFMDGCTTALSMVAMWMLSKKYAEQWLLWLVVDVLTVGLYVYKGIPVTAGLYALYSVLAVVGYRKWLKECA